MEIVSYEDVEDWQMTELYMSYFDHPHSKKKVEGKIESDTRIPNWGGELYAKRGDDVLGTAGLLYPKIRTTDGIEKIGGLRGVVIRPSESGKGVGRKLIEKIHEKLENEGVRLSILHTSAGWVAFNLYRNLDYQTIHQVPVAYKKTEGKESKVTFENDTDSSYIKSIYEESLKGLYGYTIRNKNFLKSAEARGFPDNEKIRIAYFDGEKIGYVYYTEKRDSVICKEIGASNSKNLKKILAGIESKIDQEYLIIRWTNPNYREILEEYGFKYYNDRWEILMAKGINESTGKALELLNKGKDFHIGIYEYY